MGWKRSLMVGVMGVFLALVCWRCTRQATEWASLDPQNEYVGDEACQPCHEKIYETYHETGMGHSLYRPDPTDRIERFDDRTAVLDTFSGFSYHPFWRGEAFFVTEFRLDERGDTTYRRTERIDYVVGSGNQTRSYLLERNGYLYEAPITWYVRKGIWDLSPGYHGGQNSRFSREIGEECMACHTGSFDYVEGSKNRFQEVSLGIDCERCHGPGAAHISAIEGGQLIDVGVETDYTIVNPAKLSTELRFDVCQQCHLQGINVLQNEHESVRDFRPGMALGEVYHVFLPEREDQNAFGIASHAERLQLSQCFIQSEGNLTCTSCHNPHKPTAKTDPQVYVRKCEGCHRETAVEEMVCDASPDTREAENFDCVSCHMPSGGTSDIPHVSFHDHFIRVVRENDTTLETAYAEATRERVALYCASADSCGPAAEALAWLQRYEREAPKPVFLEKAKAQLQAGQRLARARAAFYAGQLPQALSLVEEAWTEEDPSAEMLSLKAEIYSAQGKAELAHPLFRRAYGLEPEAVALGQQTAVSLLQARPGEPAALAAAGQLIDSLLLRQPENVQLRTNAGFIAMNRGELRRAEYHLKKALDLDPTHQQALENFAILRRLKAGQ